jgi:Ca2+/Na+ antiporter
LGIFIKNLNYEERSEIMRNSYFYLILFVLFFILGAFSIFMNLDAIGETLLLIGFGCFLISSHFKIKEDYGGYINFLRYKWEERQRKKAYLKEIEEEAYAIEKGRQKAIGRPSVVIVKPVVRRKSSYPTIPDLPRIPEIPKKSLDIIREKKKKRFSNYL